MRMGETEHHHPIRCIGIGPVFSSLGPELPRRSHPTSPWHPEQSRGESSRDLKWARRTFLKHTNIYDHT